MKQRRPYEQPDTEVLSVRFEKEFLGGTLFTPDHTQKLTIDENEEDF